MTTKTIEHLRNHLFTQLDALLDVTKPIDSQRAKLVNDTSQQIINTAKVEVDYVKAAGGGVIMPFLENQDGFAERPAEKEATPPNRRTETDAQEAQERSIKNEMERSTPALDPWRGLGSRSEPTDIKTK